jgi:large subunit ribosomal protein L21
MGFRATRWLPPWGRAGGRVVFAIIQSGGRQVKVTPGAVVNVDRFAGSAGEQVTIDQVLLVGNEGGDCVAGTPFVAGARVIGVVAGEVRGEKIGIFKKKRRKQYRRTKGHRSTFTQVRVQDILV